jgi:hypothetical protein
MHPAQKTEILKWAVKAATKLLKLKPFETTAVHELQTPSPINSEFL